MQKNTLFAMLFVAVCILFIACGGNEGKTFSNKTDSMAFAKAVIEQYENEPRAGRVLADTLENGDGFSPISWEQVEDYSKRYDANACLKSADGVIYQGFCIDTAGYNRLLRTKEIKGLYLRLGTKPNGANTIMILGTDQNGKIITTGGSAAVAPKDSTNFDNLNGCPTNCP